MLKILHLNIEGAKHFGRFIPFIKGYQPDIVMLQEVMEQDIPYLQRQLGLKHVVYTPMYKDMLLSYGPHVMGTLIGSVMPLEDVQEFPYFGTGHGRNEISVPQDTPNIPIRFSITAATVRHQGHAYRVATTHFPWADGGGTNQNQQDAIPVMMDILKTKLPSFILTGDFNAPRGKQVFGIIADAFTDNVPAHYNNSMDKDLHRAGHKLADLMVDGLFTTPHYKADDVVLHTGVSDHMAITATIKPA